MQGEQIPNLLLKRVSLTPDRPAIKFKEKQYSFREVYEMTYTTAGYLAHHGVKKDQFIAVLLRNHIDTAAVFLALQLLGAKAVILNNRLTVEELSWQINDSGSLLLITEEHFGEKIKALKELNSSFLMMTKELLMTTSFAKPEIQQEIDLNDVCSVMYTSGTTGHPKGVLQTYGNHWWSAVGSALNLGLNEDDGWLCTVPLFHISGYSILMRSIIYGMKMVLHEHFDEKAIIEDIKDEKVTVMSVVTATLSRILEELKEDELPGSFRCMLLGGGPAPLSVLEKCVEKRIPVYQTYGMTETASQIVTLSPEYSVKKLGSAGKPLFPAQVSIITAEGKKAKPHESGEIVVKGPNVAKGYINQDKTKMQNGSGWFHTGDIGYLDQEGFLFVQDRRSDLIISGGENIYPAEIEGILISHPDVTDAGVIGVSDDSWGQVPVAFVAHKGKLTAEEIIQFTSGKLAKYKIPKKIYFVPEIPRNASKKLLRRKLRKMLDD